MDAANLLSQFVSSISNSGKNLTRSSDTEFAKALDTAVAVTGNDPETDYVKAYVAKLLGEAAKKQALISQTGALV